MVSVVCAVMNRTPALRVALTSWLLQQDVKEIVIVDWSSTVSLVPLIRIDERIRVVRVEGETRFHVAAACNLAAERASHPVLLKLDADHVLNPYYRFCTSVPLPEHGFITGHWRHRGPFTEFLNGLVYMRAADWRRVHGYNEHLEGYGWEDDDFYGRLEACGLKRWILKPDRALAFHIPHDHDVRVANYDEKDRQKAQQRNRDQAAAVPYTGRTFAWEFEPVAPQAWQAMKRTAPGL